MAYGTPDSITIAAQDFRPIYFRVLESDTNTANKSVDFHIDIGSGSAGSFVVTGSALTQNALLVCDRPRSSRSRNSGSPAQGQTCGRMGVGAG